MQKMKTEKPTPFRITFVGGGSGGHLIPAIALCQEFSRLLPESKRSFIIPGKKLEKDILNFHEIDYQVCGGFSPRGSLRRSMLFAPSLLKSYRKCISILKQEKPNVVIGLGGYASIYGGLAAWRLGIPLCLLEQNVIPGRVNRLMSRFSKTVYAQWPLKQKKLSRKTTVMVSGNPVRRNMGRYESAATRKWFGLDPNRKTLLVMGGSQGARALNNFITSHLNILESYASQIQIIHITGSRDFYINRERWAHAKVRHYVIPFAQEMGPIIAAADVVLCRAGATTISELSGFGKPMILIPLPSSRDNHQFFNADFVASQGAAKVILENSLPQSSTMKVLLNELICNPEALSTLANRSSILGNLRAGKDIALNLLGRFGIQPSS